MGLRLSTRPSVLALVLDVLIFTAVAPFVIDGSLPVWARLVAGVLAVVAGVLGVRSAVLLARAP